VFGDRFHSLELQGEGHSTLITHRCDKAFETAVSFLTHRLLGAAWQAPPASCLKTTCALDTDHGDPR
jgi:hypothetical protein